MIAVLSSAMSMCGIKCPSFFAHIIYLMIKENHDENVASREVSLKIIPQENLHNSQECFGEQDLKH